MTLVVEDGTGLDDAESYASVEDADDYLANRGYTNWADLDEPEKEQCLRRATEYMVIYPWKGERTSATQTLDWPRTGASAFGNDLATDVVPSVVGNACILLAFRAASGELLPDPELDSTGRLPTKLVKKVGPIDKETSYATRGTVSTPGAIQRFPSIDVMLLAFIRRSSTVYR